MEYRRLKTKDSTGVPILRYYKLKEGETALANAFYGLEEGIASKIDGTVGQDVTLIGFSHGGNGFSRGLIFLDINTTVLYMAILGEDDDARPKIGEIVNGYQKVIDTHYEEESAAGKNGEKWGVEYLDVPYYVFEIVQPAGDTFSTEVEDEDAGQYAGASGGGTAYTIGGSWPATNNSNTEDNTSGDDSNTEDNTSGDDSNTDDDTSGEETTTP